VLDGPEYRHFRDGNPTAAPCLDGELIDLTLLNYLRTHPRISSYAKEFSDVQSFVNTAVSCLAAIDGDYRLHELNPVFHNTIHYMLYEWLSKRADYGRVVSLPQQWGF
jgi:hypothetical protein